MIEARFIIASMALHLGVFVWISRATVTPPEFSVSKGRDSIEVALLQKSLTKKSNTTEVKFEALTQETDFIRKLESKKEPVRATRNHTSKNESLIGVLEPSISSHGAIAKASLDYDQNPAPEYPELARRIGAEGLVRLMVRVGSSGDALSVKIKLSSGYDVLDKAAEAAVAKWKFKPAIFGGVFVESLAEIPIRFSLNQTN